jgi:hypothetical protein
VKGNARQEGWLNAQLKLIQRAKQVYTKLWFITDDEA